MRIFLFPVLLAANSGRRIEALSTVPLIRALRRVSFNFRVVLFAVHSNSRVLRPLWSRSCRRRHSAASFRERRANSVRVPHRFGSRRGA